MKLIDRIARLERQRADPNATGPLRINWIMAEAEAEIVGATADVSACACPPFTIEATGVDPDVVLGDLRGQIQARVPSGIALALVTWRTAAT